MLLWFSSFAIACLVALATTRVMISVGIGDSPDAARKLHSKITPTSGGVGIAAGVLAGFCFLAWQDSNVTTPQLLACLGLSIAGGVLGLLDDIYVLGAKLKLGVMVAATTLFAVIFVRIETLELVPLLSLPLGPILGTIGTVFWLLVLVNTVNFMDGANGLSMGCSGLGLLGLSILLVMQGQDDIAHVASIGSAACAGFLVWNAWRGAIFAGDTGALFVGLLCGSLGALAVTRGVHPLCVALCFLPLLVDAILTICWRIKHKENVLTPHSHHAYQRIIKVGGGHLHTAGRYWSQSVACVLAAAVGAHKGGFQPLICFLLMLVFLIFVYVQTLRFAASRS